MLGRGEVSGPSDLCGVHFKRWWLTAAGVVLTVGVWSYKVMICRPFYWAVTVKSEDSMQLPHCHLSQRQCAGGSGRDTT